jgi:hypothetical protein
MPKFLSVLEAEHGDTISARTATHVRETDVHLGSRSKDCMFHHFLTEDLAYPGLNFEGRDRN